VGCCDDAMWCIVVHKLMAPCSKSNSQSGCRNHSSPNTQLFDWVLLWLRQVPLSSTGYTCEVDLQTCSPHAPILNPNPPDPKNPEIHTQTHTPG
jgi:hypothetical protein